LRRKQKKRQRQQQTIVYLLPASFLRDEDDIMLMERNEQFLLRSVRWCTVTSCWRWRRRRATDVVTGFVNEIDEWERNVVIGNSNRIPVSSWSRRCSVFVVLTRCHTVTNFTQL
jgi:hypothetical protein